jgi:transcription initiation factor TFIIH subunit 2
MNVCLDRNHLRALVLAKCTPPPILNLRGGDGDENIKYCNFVEMGFPTRESSDVPTLIHVTKDKKIFARTGYLCPRCQAKASELPTDCAVCGLKLVLSPHLARSFHHLFPIPAFTELPEDDGPNANASAVPSRATSSTTSGAGKGQPSPVKSKNVLGSKHKPPGVGPQTIESSILTCSQDDPQSCFGCLKYIGAPAPESAATISQKRKRRRKGLAPPLVTDDAMSTSLRFQCPECRNNFCADCDAYLHESLHNCPGCLCKG